MGDYKCHTCDSDLIHLGGDRYYCSKCKQKSHIAKLKVSPIGSRFIEQKPYIDDTGFWIPLEQYIPEGCASNYRCLISKEFFVEAYNKWIKESE